MGNNLQKKGVMMGDYNSQESKQIDKIEDQIKQAIREIELITKQRAKINDAQDLEAVEKKIIQATDKLAGLITAQKIQQALDSEEIDQQTKELINNLPRPMKNQGQREVQITPSRGGPVKVKATYYSKKKKSKRKKKKR
jgi:hypothetical protein